MTHCACHTLKREHSDCADIKKKNNNTVVLKITLGLKVLSPVVMELTIEIWIKEPRIDLSPFRSKPLDSLSFPQTSDSVCSKESTFEQRFSAFLTLRPFATAPRAELDLLAPAVTLFPLFFHGCNPAAVGNRNVNISAFR